MQKCTQIRIVLIVPGNVWMIDSDENRLLCRNVHSIRPAKGMDDNRLLSSMQKFVTQIRIVCIPTNADRILIPIYEYNTPHILSHQ
jgi:hypothetical protein